MNDIMIDVETLSLDPNAHLLSIAAVQFDINTGATGKTFYRVILQNKTSGVIDCATVRWWMRQEQAARDEIWAWNDDQLNLNDTLIELSGFIVDCDTGDLTIWQRGPMDYTWLESAYARCYLAPPWAFWQWQDQRTATKHVPKHQLPARIGTAHNALDDCLHQIECLVRAVSFS